jgi:hypothetical protein
MDFVELTPIVLEKTHQGRHEISTRSTRLTALERRVLILADGARTLEHMQIMLNARLLGLALRLQAQGLVKPFSNPQAAKQAATMPPDGNIGKVFLLCDGAADPLPVFDTTQPGMLTHRCAADPGLLGAKAYLAEVVESLMIDSNGAMARKISAIETEAETYHVFEQLMSTLKVHIPQSDIGLLVSRFDEEISRR